MSPPGDHLTEHLYIKHLEIKGREVRSFIYNKLNSCLFVDYLIKSEGLQAVDRLMSVSFKSLDEGRGSFQYRSRTLPNSHYRGRPYCHSPSLHERPLRRETASNEQGYQDILQILRRGIDCSGSTFRFLGHSNSQLKDKTCYMFNATDEEIHDLLSRFADFSKTKGLAKRAKRVGLLFSSFNRSLSLREEEYTVIKDVKEAR